MVSSHTKNKHKAMQVSWIDPDEIAKLAAQLSGPLELEVSPSWDLNALPDISGDQSSHNTGDAFNQFADSLDAQAPENIESAGNVPPPEIEHIREKLRAIRAKAMDTGVIAAPVQKVGESVAEAKLELPVTPISPLPITISLALPPPPPASTPTPSIPSPRHAPFIPIEGPISERLASFMQWASQIVVCEDRLLMDDHGDMLWGGASRSELALSAILAVSASLRSAPQAMTKPASIILSRLGPHRELSVLPCPTRFGMVTLALLNAPLVDDETAKTLREALTLCIEGK